MTRKGPVTEEPNLAPSPGQVANTIISLCVGFFAGVVINSSCQTFNAEHKLGEVCFAHKPSDVTYSCGSAEVYAGQIKAKNCTKNPTGDFYRIEFPIMEIAYTVCTQQ